MASSRCPLRSPQPRVPCSSSSRFFLCFGYFLSQIKQFVTGTSHPTPHSPRAFWLRSGLLEGLAGCVCSGALGRSSGRPEGARHVWGAGQRRSGEGAAGFPEGRGRPGVCPRQLCFSWIITADQRAWRRRSRRPRASLRSPVIKASARCLPRGSEDVHHRGSGGLGRRRGPRVRPGDPRAGDLNLVGVEFLPPGRTQQVKTDPSPPTEAPQRWGPRGGVGELPPGRVDTRRGRATC